MERELKEKDLRTWAEAVSFVAESLQPNSPLGDSDYKHTIVTITLLQSTKQPQRKVLPSSSQLNGHPLGSTSTETKLVGTMHHARRNLNCTTENTQTPKPASLASSLVKLSKQHQKQ